jgi:GTP 3',8-cyclase
MLNEGSVERSGAPGRATDQFGRRIEYLRISVTDRCNFRCVYCMDPDKNDWLPRGDILSYEEITDIVRQVAPLGVQRLRITGGEPTIRRELHTLVRMLRDIPEIQDIALSTNGAKMEELANPLRAAGLDRVNISADSLRSDRIQLIARRSTSFDPRTAATAATRAGLDPVKINVVVMRGVNDDEIEDFARLTIDNPWHVRFIELMPVGGLRDVTWDHVVPSDELLGRVASIGALSAVSGPARGNGPARYFSFSGAAGTIGVITPMTHTYCGSCNRVRLTADGRLRTCLFGDHEVDLRGPLRSGASVIPIFLSALEDKPREHGLVRMEVGGLRALSEVGG